ncbi:unnamed protein product [Mytilus coruscus]|uniref:Uncharacterized protein n=1 Tax=Mytilus coruscus TaxID=42192 RepID=A0A6J8DAF2_MYTCO|nr:unnamed protein product [Mytilus coruscus]
MQYITAFSLAWFYFQKCFRGINGIYLKYNKVIQRILQTDNKEILVKVADLESKDQTNTIFLVKHAESYTKFFVDGHGKPYMTTSGVILLLDKYDNFYIDKTFFESACQIEHPSCPGPLHEMFLKSFRRFLSVLMFLIFVTLVVLAFGETYSISISNQLLATIAGGFVPWILMKSDFFFKNPFEPDYDHLSDNISFLSGFKGKIKNHRKTWRICEMECEKKPTALSENLKPCKCIRTNKKKSIYCDIFEIDKKVSVISVT